MRYDEPRERLGPSYFFILRMHLPGGHAVAGAHFTTPTYTVTVTVRKDPPLVLLLLQLPRRIGVRWLRHKVKVGQVSLPSRR
jgi:hypothetical protein